MLDKRPAEVPPDLWFCDSCLTSQVHSHQLSKIFFELTMSFGEIKIACLILGKTKLVLNTSYHEEMPFSARFFPANSLFDATGAHVNHK